ncbi:MAG: O-antigen ligase family protein [Ekhidna sp.]|nr:O-antigen ligase family protein [Ekhidna sp.]
MITEITSKSGTSKITYGIAGGYFLQPVPKVIAMLLLTFAGIAGTCIGGLKLAVLLMLLFLVLPPILAVVWKTQIGVYLLMTVAFFLSVGLRLIPGIPIGMSIDFLILLMLIGKGFRLQFSRNWSQLKSPLTVIILVWVIYNLSQIANPWAVSRTAFFYVIRPAVGYLMLYFLIWDTVKGTMQINRIFQYLLFLGWVAAVWGIYQFFFGYFEWEMAHVFRTDTVHLVFNHGRWRSFGPIGSPAQYGIIMASLACITGNSFFYKKTFFAKLTMAFLFLCFLMAMVYSGTRTSFIILPVFYFVKVIISRNKKLYLTIILGIIGLIILAKVPTDNYQIQRIQSVFKANEDKSYQIRAANRKMITPWILKHPIGGGLGSTGVWGQRFSPGTFLSDFPPDSGIIRVAVELGWIGLIIFLLIYLQAFFKGTKGLWQMKSNAHKDKVESITCLLPAWGLVEMGQEVAGVFPMSLLFWIFLAVLFTTLKYAKNETEASH